MRLEVHVMIDEPRQHGARAGIDDRDVAPFRSVRRVRLDADDARAFDAAKARLASGTDEIIPEAFANRLLDGENPIRVYRDLRALSARDLAAEAGISPSYLSQLEKGTRQGTPETLKTLAKTLGVSLDDLI